MQRFAEKMKSVVSVWPVGISSLETNNLECKIGGKGEMEMGLPKLSTVHATPCYWVLLIRFPGPNGPNLLGLDT